MKLKEAEEEVGEVPIPPRKQNQIVPIEKYRLGEIFYDMHAAKREERKVIAKLGYPIKQGKEAKVNSLSDISEESLEQSAGPCREQDLSEADVSREFDVRMSVVPELIKRRN